KSRPELALRSLWALYVTGGLDETLAAKLLSHPDEHVRAWTVRLLGDEKKSASIGQQFVRAAREDSSAIVRRQLACTARRLPADPALPIIKELLQHDEDSSDQHIPLLIWWAMEDKAISQRAAIIRLFASPKIWDTQIVQKFIVERVAQRYTAEAK